MYSIRNAVGRQRMAYRRPSCKLLGLPYLEAFQKNVAALISKPNHTIDVVTNYDSFFFITNCDRYYKLRQQYYRLLQNIPFFPNGRSGIYLAHSRTAAGTDQIPYWIWKEHTEIATPLASPESRFSQSPLSVCHHCGGEILSPPSPKWMSLKHMVIIAVLI